MTLEEVFAALEPVSLGALDERAALRRRVDSKYVVPREELAEVVEAAADAYEALEIDGHRAFDYESVYLDTPDLLCFRDHVDNRRPRFKIRTRMYYETEACFVEVKVKTADEETVKRQMPHDPSAHGGLNPEARRFLDESLDELTGSPAPEALAPSLWTRYRRLTLASIEGGERVTTDLDVRLAAADDRATTLRDDLALVETKTEEGRGAVDRLLAEGGHEPVTISKYRFGVGTLLEDDPGEAGAAGLRDAFA
jgi:VTC domain